MADHREQQIVHSWQRNAAPWISLIRGAGIASRHITNPAILQAIAHYRPERVLDLGCGEGWLCRQVAAQGATVTGVDAIAELIMAAREQDPDGDYRCVDYLQLADVLAGATFDLVVANFSLFGQQSVEQLLARLPALLGHDGTLLIQTLHPLMACDGDYRDGWRQSSWAGCPGNFQEPPPWYFRTLSSWHTLLHQQGYQVRIEEPLDPGQQLPASILFHARPG